MSGKVFCSRLVIFPDSYAKAQTLLTLEVPKFTHTGNGNYKMFLCSPLHFRPLPGDIRDIDIEKTSEPLGITIDDGPAGKGVFVASVTEASLAAQVGLQVRKLIYFHLLAGSIIDGT